MVIRGKGYKHCVGTLESESRITCTPEMPARRFKTILTIIVRLVFTFGWW